MPAFTAVPTAAAVCATGAVPRLRRRRPRHRDARPRCPLRRLSPTRTRAVIPVHLYGRPAPLPDLGVPVLEDAAQAHGAARPCDRGRRRAAYSFYPTKNLGGSATGARWSPTTTSSPPPCGSCVRTGSLSGYVHVRVATNARLSEIEAAALRVALARARGRERRAGARSWPGTATRRRNCAGSPTTTSVTSTTSAWPASRSARRSGAALRSRPACTTRWRSPSSPPTSEFVTTPCPEAERGRGSACRSRASRR